MSLPAATHAKEITQPGLIRLLLDRYFPRFHRLLTRIGTLSKPPELDELNGYLRSLSADIENDIRHKTYIPLAGKEFQRAYQTSEFNDESSDPFVKPIHQVIRQIIGLAQGGDAASAQIAAINRQSRVVRNILKMLRRTADPLILLGDPGTGKTMTLQQTAKGMADAEGNHIFPIITLYVRLGEFYVGGKPTPERVMDHVKRSVPLSIRPYIDALDRSGNRLVIIFDGLDEMSRDRYNEHTEALSLFAGERRNITKTLFSCRITDFSPKFIHQRLVLLPFDRAQITEYLRKYIHSFPLSIDGRQWSLKQLAKRLSQGDLPMEANNPFVLWLLCFQLRENSKWPKSRVDLLSFCNQENYKRKAIQAALLSSNPADELIFPELEAAFAEWGRFAYTITLRNRGVVIPVRELHNNKNVNRIKNLIRVGKRCGVLVESFEGFEHLIRFDHHRLQEYFTAYYIHHKRPPIVWLDKLDAPRWQETMVNLILMGGADDAAQILADSINQPIQEHKVNLELWEQQLEEKRSVGVGVKIEPKASYKSAEESAQQPQPDERPRLPEDKETIIADRIELASHILRQLGAGSSSVRNILIELLRMAISFLAAEGNPITQVKMIRVCQNVSDINFTGVLSATRSSPINWVRNQALIFASSERGARAVGSDLPTELGRDLANGEFALRFKSHVKAAIKASNIGCWWSLILASFSYLLNLSSLLAIAAFIYIGAIRLSETGHVSNLSWLTNPYSIASYVGIVLLATIISLRFNTRAFCLVVLGTAIGSLLLARSVQASWSNPFAVFTVIGFSFVLIPCAQALVITGATIHLTGLMLYLAGTTQLRGSGYRTRWFFEDIWRGSEFSEPFDRYYLRMGICVAYHFSYALLTHPGNYV